MSYDDLMPSWWGKNDDEEEEGDDTQKIVIPDLPIGGYFKPCCPDWNSSHVSPVYARGAVIRWECSHCGETHFANDLDQWNDEAKNDE